MFQWTKISWKSHVSLRYLWAQSKKEIWRPHLQVVLTWQYRQRKTRLTEILKYNRHWWSSAKRWGPTQPHICSSFNRPWSLTEEQAGLTAQEGISVPLSRRKPTQSKSTPHFVRCHVNSCVGRFNNLPPSDSTRNARIPNNTSVLLKLDFISLFRHTNGSIHSCGHCYCKEEFIWSNWRKRRKRRSE